MTTSDFLRQILARLIRIETRLVRAMDHMGLDSEGFPRQHDNVTEQKDRNHEHQS